jgi:ketosteroid isomerase-like protein
VIGALVARAKVRGAYAALNRRDLDGFLAGWAEDAVFEFPGEIAASGTFRGKPEIRRWFAAFLEAFPTLTFTLHEVALARPFTLGASNVAAVHWKIDLVHRGGRANHNRGVTMVTIRRARVVHARDYIFDTGRRFREVWGEA